MRRGISLLEVLFAMFVLAVGLLGLAAMVPVGKHQVTEANHADRGTAIGQQAFSELKIRDMNDRESWIQYDYTAKSWQAYDPTPETVAPFIVDPLAVTANIAAATPDPRYAYFPHGPGTFPTAAAPLFPKMDRITLQDIGLASPMVPQVADRIFRISDDLLFDGPSDKTLRPSLANPSGNRQAQSAGDYSWLVMFSPQPGSDPPPLPPQYLAPGQPQPQYRFPTCTVSVVVFYKRDVVVDTSDINTPASERIVYCDLIGGGLGGSFGGDVQLRIEDTATVKPTANQADKLLKVRPNQWVLLSGQDLANVPFHKWYRVVSTSEMQSIASPWIVDVTLSGPDVKGSMTRDIDGTVGNGATCYVTICDGVIGVFEKVIQLDEPSLWSSH